MKNGKYNLHISPEIQNITNRYSPKKGIVGFGKTVACLFFIVVVYLFVKFSSPQSTQEQEVVKETGKILNQNPILYVIAGGILLLCILVAILIKVVKNKK